MASSSRRTRARGSDDSEPEPPMSQLLSVMIRQAEMQQARDERAEEAKERRRTEKLARRAEEDARLAVEEARLAEEEARRVQEEVGRAIRRARQAKENAQSALEKARLAREEVARVLFYQEEYSPPTPEDSSPEESPPAQQVPPQQFQFQGNAAQVRSDGERPSCDFCGKKGHIRKDCWKARKLCLKCGAADHFVATCPRRAEIPACQPKVQLTAAVEQRKQPLPPQRDLFRQAAGKRRAQALQMIATTQGVPQETREPEKDQEGSVGDDQQNGQILQIVPTNTEAGGVAEGMIPISSSSALNTSFDPRTVAFLLDF